MGKRYFTIAMIGFALSGCASFTAQESTEYTEVCAATEVTEIEGEWRLVGLSGRKLPSYFPEAFMIVLPEDIIFSTIAYPATTLLGRPHAGHNGPCYSLSNGTLSIDCPLMVLTVGRRYEKHNKQISKIYYEANEIYSGDPIIGRLESRLCLTASDGRTLEYEYVGKAAKR